MRPGRHLRIMPPPRPQTPISFGGVLWARASPTVRARNPPKVGDNPILLPDPQMSGVGYAGSGKTTVTRKGNHESSSLSPRHPGRVRRSVAANRFVRPGGGSRARILRLAGACTPGHGQARVRIVTQTGLSGFDPSFTLWRVTLRRPRVQSLYERVPTLQRERARRERARRVPPGSREAVRAHSPGRGFRPQAPFTGHRHSSAGTSRRPRPGPRLVAHFVKRDPHGKVARRKVAAVAALAILAILTRPPQKKWYLWQPWQCWQP